MWLRRERDGCLEKLVNQQINIICVQKMAVYLAGRQVNVIAIVSCVTLDSNR